MIKLWYPLEFSFTGIAKKLERRSDNWVQYQYIVLFRKELKFIKDHLEYLEMTNDDIIACIKNGDISVLQTYQNILKRHFEANHFLKLSKPELLKDFAILVEDDNDVSVVYFDFAKRSSIEHIHKYIVNTQFV